MDRAQDSRNLLSNARAEFIIPLYTSWQTENFLLVWFCIPLDPVFLVPFFIHTPSRVSGGLRELMNHLTGRKVPHLFEFIMLMKRLETTNPRHVDEIRFSCARGEKSPSNLWLLPPNFCWWDRIFKHVDFELCQNYVYEMFRGWICWKTAIHAHSG